MYVDMHGWTISAKRFSAPIRMGFHYFGDWRGQTFVGPLNSANEVWVEILEIRAELRASTTVSVESLAEALVVALDILGMHGCADDSAGSTDETGRHLQRFGRFVLETDSRGFVSAERFSSETSAQTELNAENEKYAEMES